ncbi:uncharacterized protein LOC111024598 [Momordica charantia]|uniref:Uncharacterized protein LOC111024598 n=1 Tax=Momordica charantia TaxID=3673 RepID=A0A6J1DY55_MOMCH|nr:uncharacterized protein LOC111024598 [Momordica charantia]
MRTMITALKIMDSLRDMLRKPSLQVMHEVLKFIFNSWMKEGTSVREHVNKIVPAVVQKGKKAKVATKWKCFHYGVDGHWKRICPKYLADKKKVEGKFDLLVLETSFMENDDSSWIIDSGATNHVCSSLQAISSWRQEISL